MIFKISSLQFALLVIFVLLIGCAAKSKPEQSEPAILDLAVSGDVYLPDYSYAGYRNGESNFLEYGNEISIVDFGALPNDGIDDTEAFISAISAADQIKGTAVVKIPAGKFILSDYLYIQRDSLIIKGAGSSQTQIHINKSLSELPLPAQMEELHEYLVSNNKRVKPSLELFSAFSWTGGFLWVRKPGSRGLAYLNSYDLEQNKEAVSVLTAKRGAHFLRLEKEMAGRFMPYLGELVRVDWFNLQGKNSELLKHVYLDSLKIGERHWINSHRPLITQYATLQDIMSDSLVLKEPLLHDVRSGWTVLVSPAELLQEIGIEGLSIEFPNAEYAGHHLESGYNAIYITDASHSWISDVQINNADNAVLSDNSAFVSIEKIKILGRLGHYAVHLGKTNHFLVKELLVEAEEMHSISFNTGCKAGVFTNVSVKTRPTLDQHCGLNHQNLFDRIELKGIGVEHDIFKHGGAGYWRPTHGAYNTFWNVSLEFDSSVESPDTMRIGGITDGPHARFVGLYANRPVMLDYGPSAYQEKLNSAETSVPSLYDYQLNKRLNK